MMSPPSISQTPDERLAPGLQTSRVPALRLPALRLPALLVVLAIVAAVVLLGPGGLGAPQPTPGGPAVSSAADPA